jgi:hypothetical protein
MTEVRKNTTDRRALGIDVPATLLARADIVLVRPRSGMSVPNPAPFGNDGALVDLIRPAASSRRSRVPYLTSIFRDLSPAGDFKNRGKALASRFDLCACCERYVTTDHRPHPADRLSHQAVAAGSGGKFSYESDLIDRNQFFLFQRQQTQLSFYAPNPIAFQIAKARSPTLRYPVAPMPNAL